MRVISNVSYSGLNVQNAGRMKDIQKAEEVAYTHVDVLGVAARTSGTYKSNGAYNNALSELVSKKVDEEV